MTIISITFTIDTDVTPLDEIEGTLQGIANIYRPLEKGEAGHVMKDKNSGAVFENYEISLDTDIKHDGWAGVCESCAKIHGFADDSLCKRPNTIADMICGVIGCNSKATHYYTFKFSGKAVKR